jgi:hypothetical protein
MSDTNTEKWKTVKVPRGLSEGIDKFVKSQEGYHQGWTSNSQVVAHAIRQFLESKGSWKTEDTQLIIDDAENYETAEHEPIQ